MRIAISIAPRVAFFLLPLLFATTVIAAPAAAQEAKDLPRLKQQLVRAIEFRNAAQIKSLLEKIAATDTVEGAKIIVQVSFQLRELDLYDPVVGYLARMKDSRVRKYIYDGALKTREWMVRYLLIEVASRIADPEAEATLAAAIDDPHPMVLMHVIDLLAAARKPAAVDALIELLDRAQSKKQLAGYRDRVREALFEATGKDIEAAADWRNWWAGARGGFKFPDKNEKPSEAITSVIQRVKKRKEEHYLAELVEGDIIVVTGVFDQVQSVLKVLNLPFQLIERSQLRDMKLNPNSVLIFNCHQTDQDRLDGRTLKAIRDFVFLGGYLFTSDWELQNVIVPGFPKTIGMSTFTDEAEVKIRPTEENADHPYLRDVFPTNPYKLANYKWKIDGMSSTLRMQPGARIYTLVESEEMQKKYGNPYVAATFRHGKGSVLHVMSHFQSQMDPEGDGYALQQMLANFIIEKQKWRRGEISDGDKRK